MGHPVYAITREVRLDFEDALSLLRAALLEEGFHILWEEDAHDWLEAMGGDAFPRYTILGVGDPERTRAALLAEPELGVLMPFHVIAYSLQPGRTVLASVRPTDVFDRVVRNRDVSRLVSSAEGRLRQAIVHVRAAARAEASAANES